MGYVPNNTYTKWFVTFINDHTQVYWVYLLKEKTEVPNVFINFHLMIKTQLQTQVQILQDTTLKLLCSDSPIR